MSASHKTPIEFFAGQAAEHPGAVAVICDGKGLTFRELDLLSNRMARFLRARGVRRTEPIAILANKNLQTVVSILAAWKIGCPYVPLDIEAPGRRIRHFLDVCAARFAVVDANKFSQWPETLLERQECLVLGEKPDEPRGHEFYLSDLPDYSEAPLDSGHTPDELAYVIFTSGSTGLPKGVMISTGNLAHFIHWCACTLAIEPHARALNIANFSFDQSVMDLAFMLGCGAELHLYAALKHPLVLADYIREQAIQVLSTVPTIFSMLLDSRYNLSPAAFASLETLFIGGAACPPGYLQQFNEKMPGAEVYNIYGPTEATVYCAYHKFTPSELRNGVVDVPLGKPLPNHSLCLIDDRQQPVRQRGELVVHGPQVMVGYWQQEEFTRSAFVEVQGQDGKGYRTGDIVREGPNGELYFAGRANDTIKSGGHRIDLHEVEEAMLQSKGVAAAVVVAVPDPLLENRLMAFVTGAGGGQPAIEGIQQGCSANLPGYMVPEKITVVEEFPLNSSGKIDKKRLISDFERGDNRR